MSLLKVYIQDIETGEYISVGSDGKITVDKDPYVWTAEETDADNEYRFKDSKSEGYIHDNGKEFDLINDSFDGSLWWTNANSRSIGYFIDNVETKTQFNRKYGDKNESFTFVRVEQNIKEPDVE